jgi:hypothetical protein
MPSREHKVSWYKQIHLEYVFAGVLFGLTVIFFYQAFRSEKPRKTPDVAPRQANVVQTDAVPPELTKAEQESLRPVAVHIPKLRSETPLCDLRTEADQKKHERREMFYEAIRQVETKPGEDNPYQIVDWRYWQDACQQGMVYDPVLGYTPGWEYKPENYNDPKKAKNVIDWYARRYEPKAFWEDDWFILALLHRLGCNWEMILATVSQEEYDEYIDYAERVCNLIGVAEKEKK